MKSNLLIIGSSNTDMVIKTSRLPAAGETVLGGKFEIFPGGKGANQAVAAARAGAPVTFLTALGDDSFGSQSLERFKSEGMDISRIKIVPGMASGIALILVDDRGENIIAVAPGANHCLLASDLQPEDFAACSHVVLQMEIPIETICQAILLAESAGCFVILNPAPAAQLPPDILSCVDVLVPNQGELGILTGMPTDTEDSMICAARNLIANGIEAVVITRGERGSLLVDEERVLPVPSIPVQAVDTVGAGDCFTGCLAAGLCRGMEIEEALHFATAAASLSVQHSGAQPSFPSREQIEFQMKGLS